MRTRSTVGPAVSVATVFAVLACGAAGDTDVPQAEQFWEPITISGDEVEGYATLTEMAPSADVVARGRIADYGVSREVTTDAPEDVVTYGALSFVPTEELRGTGPAEIPVELVVNVPQSDVEDTVRTQAENLPDEELVMFLREKQGAGEAGLYRLVNSHGMWTMVDGTPTAPATDDPDEAYARYEPELAEVDSLDELAALVGG